MKNEELKVRIEALEQKFDSIVILTPYQIRVIQWTANAITGLVTLGGAAFLLSQTLKVFEHLKGFFQ